MKSECWLILVNECDLTSVSPRELCQISIVGNYLLYLNCYYIHTKKIFTRNQSSSIDNEKGKVIRTSTTSPSMRADLVHVQTERQACKS